MQLHPGPRRNHNRDLYERFGPTSAPTFPGRIDFVDGLRPLLNRFGNDPRFRLVLFTLDESTFSRRTGPDRRALSRRVPRATLVVPRQRRRHAALSPGRHRDGRIRQHLRIRRRHSRIPVDSRPPRRRPPGRLPLPRRTGLRPPTRTRRGARNRDRPRRRPARRVFKLDRDDAATSAR